LPRVKRRALGKEIIQKKKSLPRACTGALGKEIIQKKRKFFCLEPGTWTLGKEIK
jgi:proteasome lid subunit RPN8/RPN11